MQNIVPMSRNFLELRLGQSLTLTPALQQSIKLLQLSALDLEAEIARALAENPLLEQEGEGLQTPAVAAIAHPGDGPVYEGDARSKPRQKQTLPPTRDMTTCARESRIQFNFRQIPGPRGTMIFRIVRSPLVRVICVSTC